MRSKQTNVAIFLVAGLVFLVAALQSVSYLHRNSIDDEKLNTVFSVLVVPHHDILTDQFQSFYNSISQSNKTHIKHVIILAPNHFEPEQTDIKTTDQPLGSDLLDQVAINANVLSLLKNTGVVVDQAIFAKEHAVFLHVPLIAKNFPEATITPLLLTRNIPQITLDTLVETLKQFGNSQETLVLVSTDFSHDLTFSQAEKRDQQTLATIIAGDQKAILRFNDEYLDCPACMYVVLELLGNISMKPEVIFHGNSTQFLRLSANAPTTSYYVLRW